MERQIRIVHCMSGFWAVFVDGQLLYGASPNREHAERVAEWVRTGGLFPRPQAR